MVLYFSPGGPLQGPPPRGGPQGLSEALCRSTLSRDVLAPWLGLLGLAGFGLGLGLAGFS